MSHDHGFHVSPDEIAAQVAALAAVGDQTTALAASAQQLAERRPMLGTAPPALHLAAQLQEAAGRSGLAGAISAADAELGSFHRTLRAAIANYVHSEADVRSTLNAAGEEQP